MTPLPHGLSSRQWLDPLPSPYRRHYPVVDPATGSLTNGRTARCIPPQIVWACAINKKFCLIDASPPFVSFFLTDENQVTWWKRSRVAARYFNKLLFAESHRNVGKHNLLTVDVLSSCLVREHAEYAWCRLIFVAAPALMYADDVALHSPFHSANGGNPEAIMSSSSRRPVEILLSGEF